MKPHLIRSVYARTIMQLTMAILIVFQRARPGLLYDRVA